MSPTLKAESSSTPTVVSPTATDVESSFTSEDDTDSKAVADGQVATNKLFPHAPAVLLANVPTAPWPVL